LDLFKSSLYTVRLQTYNTPNLFGYCYQLIKSSSYYINTYTAAKAAISFHWIKMKGLFKNCDYDYEYDLHSNYEREVWSLVGAIQAVCIRYLHSISERTDSIRLNL
jgi:hypothetical protein